MRATWASSASGATCSASSITATRSAFRTSFLWGGTAADAARGHLGDLDAGLLQKAAVDVDLAEFVLDQHELFAAVGFRDQLFDERGLAGAQKAGENVNFRHKKYASFFFIDFQTYIISRICERFKSFSTQDAPFFRSQAHTGQRHTMI